MICNGTSATGLRANLNFTSGGVAIIAQDSPLPALSQPVVIDASTQAGYVNRPVIAIDGIVAGPGDGLSILAPGCELRGLIIGRFQQAGIAVRAADARVTGCWVGMDPTGGAAWANGGDGILVRADRAVIGGARSEERRVGKECRL